MHLESNYTAGTRLGVCAMPLRGLMCSYKNVSPNSCDNANSWMYVKLAFGCSLNRVGHSFQVSNECGTWMRCPSNRERSIYLQIRFETTELGSVNYTHSKLSKLALSLSMGLWKPSVWQRSYFQSSVSSLKLKAIQVNKIIVYISEATWLAYIVHKWIKRRRRFFPAGWAVGNYCCLFSALDLRHRLKVTQCIFLSAHLNVWWFKLVWPNWSCEAKIFLILDITVHERSLLHTHEYCTVY